MNFSIDHSTLVSQSNKMKDDLKTKRNIGDYGTPLRGSTDTYNRRPKDFK